MTLENDGSPPHKKRRISSTAAGGQQVNLMTITPQEYIVTSTYRIAAPQLHTNTTTVPIYNAGDVLQRIAVLEHSLTVAKQSMNPLIQSLLCHHGDPTELSKLSLESIKSLESCLSLSLEKIRQRITQLENTPSTL